MATKLRNVRVPDDLWVAAMFAAHDRDTTLSAVIVERLQQLVDEHVRDGSPRVEQPAD